MDNYRNEWLDNSEADLLNRETEILQQLQKLQDEYKQIQTRKTEIKSVKKWEKPISDLIWNNTWQWIYSWLVQGIEYPVKLGGKWEWGTAQRSGDNNIYYRDNNWNIVQASSSAPYNPAGGRWREIYDNIETYATDVKRGANALIKWNAYSNLKWFWNFNRRWIWRNLLNNRSSINSSMKRLWWPLNW